MSVVNPSKVLVEDINETVEKTSTGIFIPNSVKIPTMKGKIIIVGSGTPDIPIVHKVGTVCLFNPRAGQKLEWNGKEYRLVDAAEIFLSDI